MNIVAIIGNGPVNHIPDLTTYKNEVNIWIGADAGALTLINQGINVDYAVGDFDSIDEQQLEQIKHNTVHTESYPAEKNETDLEIALQKAISLQPDKIYLFGVTGGRLDHALINIQLLQAIHDKKIRGLIMDKWNQLELTHPGRHMVMNNEHYPYISFIPLTNQVDKISLSGFRYPLVDYDLSWGSTRCISNELINDSGTFTYESGILLLIKSRDVTLF